MLIVYGLLGLIMFVVALFFALGLRSQSGSARGLRNGKLASLPAKPNCVSSEDGTAVNCKIDSLPADKWGKLKPVVTEMGGVITHDQEGYMDAEFTSKIFKFVDDFEAHIDGGEIHIRSASRVGYSDRGVNRQRVEALRAAL